jgi:putative membrane protein insertion efficiency factor
MFSVIAKFFIRYYQIIVSPLLGTNCRFTPSCSQYTIEAIDTHGTCKGIYLGSKRVLRCHPFADCGHDPIPPKITPTIK